MRRTSFAFLLIACLFLAACDDGVVVPLSVSWLEWPIATPPDRPFDVRIVGFTDAAIDEVRIRTRTEGDTVTIEPYGFEENCADLCRFVFDRVVQVPGIPASTTRTIWLRTPQRIFGPVILTEAIPMDYTMRAAGGARATQHASGCYEITPALDGSGSSRRFVSHEAPPDSAPVFTAFIYGRIHSTETASCGPVTASVIVVDSIQD
jgi:hypothetical protein